jgi:peptidoglycan hydrolase-like protein with peptidoglycan-binding domain
LNIEQPDGVDSLVPVMKTRLLVLFLVAALFAPSGARAAADAVVREAQTELKSQGFYYGEADGVFNSETSAAIKRYQIRNGLEVTGTLTQGTLEALGLAEPKKTPARNPSPPPVAAPPPSTTGQKPPTNLRRNETIEESDQTFLRREDGTVPRGSNDPSIVAPPAPLDPTPDPDGTLAGIFSGTPYATAPREVQDLTVRKAQLILSHEGFYREAIDGDPGPATEEAVLAYQRRQRLPLTGRLDLPTLAQMRLLPTRAIRPPARPFFGSPHSSPQRTYRGIWID